MCTRIYYSIPSNWVTERLSCGWCRLMLWSIRGDQVRLISWFFFFFFHQTCVTVPRVLIPRFWPIRNVCNKFRLCWLRRRIALRGWVRHLPLAAVLRVGPGVSQPGAHLLRAVLHHSSARPLVHCGGITGRGPERRPKVYFSFPHALLGSITYSWSPI